MKVLFAPVILAAVGCYCQAPLPGMQQWQRQMQQHAVAERRVGTERGLWQSQQNQESNESEEKPVSFLDKLSAIFVPTTETPEHSDVFEENEYEYDYQDLDSFELERSSLINIFDDNDNIIEEHSERGLEAILGLDYLIESENSNQFDETFKGGKRPKIFLEEEFLTTEQDIAKNFLAEEIDSAQSETKELVDEMEKMLSILEVEAASDSALIEKTLSVIRSKLGSSSVQDLLGDTDFKNSVFYRFAIMRLPLREEDIPVAELSEVKKVIHNNIVTAAEETKELLKELKKDISEESNANDEARAHRLDDARRQLKKLLEIVSL